MLMQRMASTSLSVSVHEMNINEHRNRQVCRVSSLVAEKCGLSFGSCVRLRLRDRSVVCCVFPGSYSGDYIHYSSCVTENVCKGKEQMQSIALLENENSKVEIQCLRSKKATKVKVKLVVKDLTIYKSQSSGVKLAERCVRSLQDMYLTSCCTVDLSASRLAKLYGICRCTIQASLTDCGETDDFTAAQITPTTEVQIDSVQSVDCYRALELTSCLAETDGEGLGGLEQEMETLAQLLSMPPHLCSSQGVLLRGPPGVGKTSLVRQVAHTCGAALLTLSGPDLLSSNPGESKNNLASWFSKAVRLNEEVPCILFLDEVDSICPRRSSATTNSSHLTSALLTQLDRVRNSAQQGRGFLVVMATNQPSALDPDLRRPGRLDREISISVPTVAQRRHILNIYLSRRPLSDDLDLGWLSTVTSGYVGADLEMVCLEAWRKAMHRHVHGDVKRGSCAITQPDVEAALLAVRPSLQRGVDSVVDVRKVPWSEIGGLDTVKTQIQQAVEWPMLYPEAYSALGLPLAKGVLLYGPPGCGKTTLAQAAATACHVTFLSLNCAQLYSPYVGDSEKKISETFQKARALSPSILFLDEIDSIVGKRSESSSSSSVSERVLSALLNEMDGIGVRLDEKADSGASAEKVMEGEEEQRLPQVEQTSYRHSIEKMQDRRVLVVAATNRPDMLDAALLRPGRMDRLIFVPLPDLQGRIEALRVHTKAMPLAQDVNIAELAGLTLGYTGADIKGVCQEAGLLALKESISASSVKKAHFEEALTACRPSLPDTAQMEARYKQIQR